MKTALLSFVILSLAAGCASKDGSIISSSVLNTGAETIQYSIDDGSLRPWTIAPELKPDTLEVECRDEIPTIVRFVSDIDRGEFRLKGTESIQFDVKTSNGQLAATQISCVPVRLRYEGNYAVSPTNARNFQSDLHSGTLDAHIREMMAVRKIPGVSVVVVQGQAVLFQKSYGVSNIETNTPLTDATPMRLASATKVLSGLALLSAAEDDIIDLDASLGEYLPDAPDDWKRVPLWRMMNLTSGLPTLDAIDMNDAEKSLLKPPQIYDYLRQHPLDFAPGSQRRYQQSPYSIFAHILEQKTGLEWEEFLSQHVFDPASMRDSYYGDSLTEHPPAYVYRDAAPFPEEYYYPKGVSMAGGYNVSARDMSNLFKAWNAGEIVSNTFYAGQIFDADRLPDGRGYSLATIVNIDGSTRTVGHEGGAGAANIRYAPDAQIGIAVFTNLNANGAAQDISQEITELLYVDLGKQP